MRGWFKRQVELHPSRSSVSRGVQGKCLVRALQVNLRVEAWLLFAVPALERGNDQILVPGIDLKNPAARHGLRQPVRSHKDTYVKWLRLWLVIGVGEVWGCCRRGAGEVGHLDISGPYATLHLVPRGAQWFGQFCPWFVADAREKGP